MFYVESLNDVDRMAFTHSLRSLAVFGELGRGSLGSSPAREEIRPAQKLCVFEFRPLATCLFTQSTKRQLQRTLMKSTACVFHFVQKVFFNSFLCCAINESMVVSPLFALGTSHLIQTFVLCDELNVLDKRTRILPQR